MSLSSDHFTKPFNQKLDDCSKFDRGHISQTDNNIGEHVALIHTALLKLAEREPGLADFTKKITFTTDFVAKKYGAGTADAILYYKNSRDLIDRKRQTKVDNIVGVLTIHKLDKEIDGIQKEGLNKPDKPPDKPVLPPDIPRKTQTGLKWHVRANLGLMVSVEAFGQIGIAFYTFRNDETLEERIFYSPQFGVGFDPMSVLKIIKWVKQLAAIGKIPEKILEAVLKNPGLLNPKFLANPLPLLKEIASAIVTGLGFRTPWTTFSNCTVLVPVTFKRLDGKTIATKAASAIIYQAGHMYVYGPTRYIEESGKPMTRKRDLMDIDSSGWWVQFPGVSFTGGPLLLI